MTDEIREELNTDQWLPLRSAFERLGKATFGVNWDKTNISMSPGQWQLDAYSEEILFVPNYTIRATHPEEWGDYWNSLPDDRSIATEENVEQYAEVKHRLCDLIWKSELPIQTVAMNGEEANLSLKIWKDQTGQYEISFYDSEILQCEPSGNSTRWLVNVSTSHFTVLLEHVEMDRRASVRKRASKKNPNKGGRPPTYDWGKIGRYIREILKNSDEATSDSLVATEVGKRLEGEGIDPPVSSALRKAVKQAREA